MNAKKTGKLVFIHANERPKRKFSEGYNLGPHYKCDVDPDNNLLEDSSLELQQLRWTNWMITELLMNLNNQGNVGRLKTLGSDR